MRVCIYIYICYASVDTYIHMYVQMPMQCDVVCKHDQFCSYNASGCTHLSASLSVVLLSICPSFCRSLSVRLLTVICRPMDPSTGLPTHLPCYLLRQLRMSMIRRAIYRSVDRHIRPPVVPADICISTLHIVFLPPVCPSNVSLSLSSHRLLVRSSR